MDIHGIGGSLKSLARRGGIDRAIAYSVIGRGWSVIAAPITLLLIGTRLTKEEQGYYYTFNNILAITLLFELGISSVILQFAAHEKANLDWQPDGTLGGDPTAKARLASLLRLALLWYGAISALVLLVVLPAGFWFFATSGKGAAVQWQVPWLCVVIITSLTCLLSPIWAVIEGCGLVTEVASVRISQQIGGNVLLWLSIYSKFGLFAAPVVNTFAFAWAITWMFRKKRLMLADLLGYRYQDACISWRREFWPMQWKIGLSFFSGFLIFQLPNPILFRMYGPVTAGQWGMSYALANAASPLGSAWINTKIPRFGTLIARRRWEELDRLFFHALRQSSAVVVMACSLICSGVLCVHWLGYPFSQRLLSPPAFLLLVAVAMMNHVAFALAAYLRAHKQEPLLGVSLAYGAFMPTVGLVLAWMLGALGMALAFFIGTLVFLFIGGLYIFHLKRRCWHKDSSDETDDHNAGVQPERPLIMD